jgi:SAM-dependent methyltransferase
MTSAVVAWHDVECHGYEADLDLWLRLAEQEDGPVLDVGAGTGRVALTLAAAGHEVTALDLEPDLLAALRERAAAEGSDIAIVCADAETFETEQRFNLVIVPMQTVQLLDDRGAFLRAARRALAPGGLLAATIADELVAFEGTELPEPDVGEWDGVRYVSQPTAVRLGERSARIERIRISEQADGGRHTEADVIELAVLDPATLAAEARAAGLTPVPGERIPPTGEHVGSSVVMFRA